ncbi:hypothetical protein E3N88_21743 [Mikania micrantha]|uniref:Uncharacterized protein n=1 Tax=Mikania micrantha TaxID=192012 RepID=A0A5N6N8E3_9ASTR|nr:hypothetical protein E3N88_21743 [Mikania micrantha]
MVRPALDLPVSMETQTANRLDHHEQQLKHLQSDVSDIKSLLLVLEADCAESSEFRQVVLAWMKNQEKSKLDGSSDSGPSSGTPDSVTTATSHFCYSMGSGLLTANGPQVLGQGEPKSVNTPKLIERRFSVCSDNSRSVLFNKPGSMPIEGGVLTSRDRGIRYLSHIEWEEWRQQGPCYRCGQQFGPTHECSEGWYLSCYRGTKISKFDGALQGIPVSMMMDSGATRNFLSQCLCGISDAYLITSRISEVAENAT